MSSETSTETESGALDDPAPATDGAMIEAVGLSKYYGQFVAIEDVSFSVPGG